MKAFLITRDRVTYAKQVVKAFDAAGLETVIIDHGSTWQPCIDWLDEMYRDGRRVFWRGPGNHPRSLWSFEPFTELAGDERYVVSDPDTPPSQDCPADWLDHLTDILDRWNFPKVGLGLRLDNLPDHYQRKSQVLDWEKQYWVNELEEGIFLSSVDTTIALHQPLEHTDIHTLTGLRTDYPYVADHLPWYEDFHNLTRELSYYHKNAERDISFWTTPGKSCYWKD